MPLAYYCNTRASKSRFLAFCLPVTACLPRNPPTLGSSMVCCSAMYVQSLLVRWLLGGPKLQVANAQLYCTLRYRTLLLVLVVVIPIFLPRPSLLYKSLLIWCLNCETKEYRPDIPHLGQALLVSTGPPPARGRPKVPIREICSP